MKKAAIFFTVALLTIKAIAQAEPAGYITAVAKFTHFYNNDQVDSIFAMFSPEMKKELPIDNFKPTTAQLKANFGDLLQTKFVKFKGPLALYKATFRDGTFFLNISLDTQNRLVGLLLSPYQEEPAVKAAAHSSAAQSTISVKKKPAVKTTANSSAAGSTTTVKKKPAVKTTADSSGVESPVLVKTLSGQISGTLTMPKTVEGKIPVMLIIGDSGPTDRNGNNEKAGINDNTYKMLAEGLAANGIASVRYDKRFAGQSISTTTESQLRVDDYSDDAIRLITMLNNDQRFSKIILFGHGEGALVSMLAMYEQPVAALIVAECPAEPADKIMIARMAKTKPKYQVDEFRGILDSLRKGKTIDNVDPSLYYIAGPGKQNFLMSLCRLDPERGIKKTKIPLMIIQGSTDLVTGPANGEKLKRAKSDATFLLVKGMNHILKDAPADEDKNLDTYNNPDLPLSAPLVPGIAAFIKKIR